MERKKFYIGVDCEGCACVVGQPGKRLGDTPNYPFTQRQATREANAAARALFDAGAEEVIIWDNHSSGINLDYDAIDPRCHIALGGGPHGRFPKIDENFGGVLFIGYHAREGTKDSVIAHTYSSTAFQYYKVNDVEVGEMEIDAAFAAKKGVPVIFVSSDDKAVAQAQESFPWAETVVTKESLSWSSALSKHPQRVENEIYEGVRRACARLPEMRPYGFTEPLKLEIRYKRLDDASAVRLVDREGRPFAFVDAFTRAGVLDAVERIF